MNEIISMIWFTFLALIDDLKTIELFKAVAVILGKEFITPNDGALLFKCLEGEMIFVKMTKELWLLLSDTGIIDSQIFGLLLLILIVDWRNEVWEELGDDVVDE